MNKKRFVSGDKTLTVEFSENRIEMVVTQRGKNSPIDKLTSRSHVSRETVSDLKWFIEKNGSWYVEVLSWWIDEGYPSVQPRPVYNQKRKW